VLSYRATATLLHVRLTPVVSATRELSRPQGSVLRVSAQAAASSLSATGSPIPLPPRSRRLNLPAKSSVTSSRLSAAALSRVPSSYFDAHPSESTTSASHARSTRPAFALPVAFVPLAADRLSAPIPSYLCPSPQLRPCLPSSPSPSSFSDPPAPIPALQAPSCLFSCACLPPPVAPVFSIRPWVSSQSHVYGLVEEGGSRFVAKQKGDPPSSKDRDGSSDSEVASRHRRVALGCCVHGATGGATPSSSALMPGSGRIALQPLVVGLGR
jgi:hypothetical protein